ncbi:unnamed protein product [Cunninghamella blakesleeana]
MYVIIKYTKSFTILFGGTTHSILSYFFYFNDYSNFQSRSRRQFRYYYYKHTICQGSNVNLHVQDTEFRFFLKPYFLRLYFPGPLVEDDDSKASYDPSSGEFIVRVSKEKKGEHFNDLDLLTKLLARKGEADQNKSIPKKPLIEVISSQPADDDDNNNDTTITENNDVSINPEYQEAIDFNWELPQELPQNDLLIQTSYGFNNQYNGYLAHVEETANEIISISNPEKSTIESRRLDRIENENIKFDEDHYAMDYINQKEFSHILQYKTIYAKELKKTQKLAKENTGSNKGPLIQEIGNENNDMNIDQPTSSANENKKSLINFSDKDQNIMRNLPNKEYLLSSEKVTYLSIIDILFAYCFNHRICEGENNVESIWCIGKISSTLSCLEQFTTLKDVIITSFRRALAYPLYRNWDLCEKVLQDVYILFKLGKRAILKAFLEMKDLFDHHDVYYIYSKIWLDDYCIWIQHSSDNVLRTLAHELHHFKINRSDIEWDLEELEEVARHMQEMGGTDEQTNEQMDAQMDE